MADLILNKNGIQQKIKNNKGYPGIPIIEIVSNGFFTIDRQGTVKYWNKAAEKLSGVSAKDITGKTLWEKFAGIVPLEFHEVCDKVFLQNAPVHFEEYWGEMGAWFDVIAYRCDDTLSVSFKSNTHPEDPANLKLKTLNELYKFVTEVTNDCLWEWGLLSREIFWIDGGHKRVFGYPIEDAFIPQFFWESRLHPDDKTRLLAKLNTIITEGPGAVWEEEYRFERSNGEYAYVHDRGHIIYEGNKATRIIGATQDITDRKLTEIQLLESEKKLSLIAKQTVTAIIITDAAEKITWVNSAFTRITEYQPEEVMGKIPGSFLEGRDTVPAVIEYLRQHVDTKQSCACDIEYYSKSGRKIWMHVQGQPLLDEDGNCGQFFFTVTDITEKILLENKLVQERLIKQKEITEAVITAQENERGDMGKELHDNLNQILGAAKLYIEMAKTDPAKRNIFLDKASGYVVNVIEEIRKISKTLVPPGMNIIGLFDSIKILLDDLKIIHPVKIEFDKHGIDQEDLDEKLQMNIFRIVQEQLNNILKHADATIASINLSRYENKIILVIADNGNGFDTKERRKGVGIRNIMSRAELCHGKAEIKSNPGEGFELSVVFPLSGSLI